MFTDLWRRALGLDSPPRRPLPSLADLYGTGGGNGVGGGSFDYYNSNEGNLPFLDLYARTLFRDDPGLSRYLQRNGGAIVNDYRAAVGAEPTLQFTDYLQRLDPYKRYKQATAFERGTNPGAFTRAVKTIGF